MMETPSISGSTYASSAVNLAAQGGLGGIGQLLGNQQNSAGALADPKMLALFRGREHPQPVQLQQENKHMATRRLVQVFIADPDENVPLEQSMLYQGEQKLTDATDQELFFEIDIKTAIDKHNLERIKIINKKVKERTEYLEPAKIRDLKMVVVTVANFN